MMGDNNKKKYTTIFLLYSYFNNVIVPHVL